MRATCLAEHPFGQYWHNVKILSFVWSWRQPSSIELNFECDGPLAVSGKGGYLVRGVLLALDAISPLDFRLVADLLGETEASIESLSDS